MIIIEILEGIVFLWVCFGALPWLINRLMDRRTVWPPISPQAEDPQGITQANAKLSGTFTARSKNGEKTMIDFYFWPTPNGYKPLLLLEEAPFVARWEPWRNHD